MISVLTITYQRHHLLEEAIQSFLLQDYTGESEMVIINDSPEVKYHIDHPKVRVINCEQRFPSIASKLEWGYKQCKYDYIYRLDDDDLLAPHALSLVHDDIEQNPGNDIYRSKYHYFFSNNSYIQLSDNINTGNVYTKEYLDRITFPDKSGDEDADITFHHGAEIYTAFRKECTMIYRWGMGTYHISGMGANPNDVILERTDQSIPTKEEGDIRLMPHFKHDYYVKLPRHTPYAWHR